MTTGGQAPTTHLPVELPRELPVGRIWPDLATFRVLARDHRVIPVTRRLLADTQTPVGLFAQLGGGRHGSFLLESADSHGSWGRWSFVGVRSAATLVTDAGARHARWIGEPPVGVPRDGEPLAVLRATLEQLQTASVPGLPPLTGGLVGYIGWDAVGRWETLPRAAVDDLGVPEMALCLVTDLAVVDHRDASVWLIANAVNHDGTDERVDQAWADAVARLDRMTSDLASTSAAPAPMVELEPDAAPTEDEVVASVPRERYLAMVEAAKLAIYDGEAFQVVVAQRFSVATGGLCALDLYRALRAANPSPYMYLLHLDDAAGRPLAVVGSSPESLVRVRGTADGSGGREVGLRPIAGTRPRSGDIAVDAARAQDLMADPKERSEHLMLVDLARNDLSRVCLAGSVTVDEYMAVHQFSHVMHIASTVRGRLRADADAVDVFAATFPAGTLSGAPKVRAMELIDALEPTRRGVYGGAVGYFGLAGDTDLAIAIRTGVLFDGVLHVQAGAGIVADSVAETEYDECRSKAAAVLGAAARARRLRPVTMTAGSGRHDGDYEPERPVTA